MRRNTLYGIAASLLLAAYAIASLYPFHPLRWGFPHVVTNGAQPLPGGGIRFAQPGIARTAGPPDWVVDALASDRLELSLRVRSFAPDQTGPARILTVSAGPIRRNLTLAQDGLDLILRLRTPATDLNGSDPAGGPVARVAGVFRAPAWVDLRLGIEPGRLRLELDGAVRAALTLPPQALRGWDPGYPLALGNELTNDRPWLGEISRALVSGSRGAVDYAAAGALAMPARFWSAIGPSTLVPFRERNPSDAALNLLGYLPLGLLLGAWGRGRRVLLLILAVFVVSAGFETLQFVVAERHPSTTDLLLNTLGGAAGVLLAWWPARWRPRLATQRAR